MWHPWRAIRARPDITVRWAELDGRLGTWHNDSRTMTLEKRQGQAQCRATATHELVHAERGHRGCQPGPVEDSVRREVARRHISIYALVDAVLFYGETNIAALADELWCPQDTVVTRLLHLHPAERGYLTQRLRAQDGAP